MWHVLVGIALIPSTGNPRPPLHYGEVQHVLIRCPKCGRSSEGPNFCIFCGAKLKPEEAHAPASIQLRNKGLKAFNAGDFKTAASILESALKAMSHEKQSAGDLAEVAFWIGNSYWRWDQDAMWKKAYDAFAASVKLNPSSPYAYNGVAVIEANYLNAPIVAENDFKRSIELDSANPWTHLNYGSLLQRLNKFDVAEQEIQHSIKIYDRDANAHHQLGDVLYRTNRADQAKSEYETALSIDSDSHANQMDKESPAHQSLTYFNLGLIAFDNKAYEESVAKFQAALEIQPASIEAALELGKTYLTWGESLGERNEDPTNKLVLAKTEFTKILGANSANSEAHLFLGITYRDLQDIAKDPDLHGKAKAAAEFQAAVNADPTSFRAHYELGSLLANSKDFEEGETELRKAISIASNGNQTITKREVADAHWWIAWIKCFQGKFDEADVEAKVALDLNPDKPSWSQKILEAIAANKGGEDPPKRAPGDKCLQ